MTDRPVSSELLRRPRRLRGTPAMRSLVAETHLHPSDFILPMFVAEGIDEPRPISSMPSVVQHTLDSLVEAVHEAVSVGIRCVDLFGVPLEEHKDAVGSGAWDRRGILNEAIAKLRREFGNDVLIMADTCLDEFTDHGHCGVLSTDRHGAVIVDNDATLTAYARMAVAQAEAGAHIISPSGMMDGQVRVIRQALDEQGFSDVAIMAYSAKYASAFYGPFREAVGSSLQGDRRTYQQDPANFRESLLEVELDVAEGADFVMVKPAMPYLDVLREVAQSSPVPVAAYQVSGEYAMLHAAAQNGWLDLEAVMMESLTSIKRAGAQQILTYFAVDAAKVITSS
ncbi:porphobilinogen synthase [Corynebacterium sp. 153RC1]|uniref:porphobilinogen synthase n=1 Tax=unclassified Corynebacterium TaxID=2624378 RepID=UPI00211C8104|nr:MULTISPECIES: porphobilinogen synthase [unclassified Corynebacterium]MCQ9370524.1 porphobilinogen synthase [Corynebacterium sp. 35RC1]MCQ9351777.1 porphobilinogen synthase [Corynebacterium sp. 209RC1]MCQ9354513.1 porphobilinogen synthase [Corynebacterium sp. 1222RC1]MCQ9356059.1 porphobilinogen synthase [Corynebacterium sp. 122RC1]MCQ9358691.1 porphobilinogen synthase [Corynebacterium sp. 142RC1]